MQNGGFINPRPEKPQYRDPYGEYFDKQERRNFGDPVHEDHDILGALSLHDYNHFTPGWGGVLVATFIATVAGLCVVVAQIHPDKVSVPIQYEGGLEAELGGPRAVRVSDVRFDDLNYADRYRRRKLVRRLHGNIERARKERCT